jgi:hypothetical protein
VRAQILKALDKTAARANPAAVVSRGIGPLNASGAMRNFRSVRHRETPAAMNRLSPICWI